MSDSEREIRALAARLTQLEAKVMAEGFATGRVNAPAQLQALGLRATNLERGQATLVSQMAALTVRVTALEQHPAVSIPSLT